MEAGKVEVSGDGATVPASLPVTLTAHTQKAGKAELTASVTVRIPSPVSSSPPARKMSWIRAPGGRTSQ